MRAKPAYKIGDRVQARTVFPSIPGIYDKSMISGDKATVIKVHKTRGAGATYELEFDRDGSFRFCHYESAIERITA